jgi:hypothetical protein
MQKIERAVVITLGAMFLIAGCGGSPSVRPDDMSAEEHGHEARVEEAVAQHYDAEYDPNAVETRETGGIARRTEGAGALRTFNPTDEHRAYAATHREHAAEHVAAAQALRTYEADECRAFPPDTRAACPLLSDVTGIEDIEGGVRIVFASGVAVDAVIARMRCHFAYARTRAYEGMQSCPLYLRGIDVRAGAGHSIDLVGTDPATVRAVREEARLTTSVTPR